MWSFFHFKTIFWAQPSPSWRAKRGKLLNDFFSGYTYPSHKARNTLNSAFEKLEMHNLTSEMPENGVLIVITRDFLRGKKTAIEVLNQDKKLSDHIGICITISEE